jgi:predicted nucleic acid-binding protein
LKGLRGNIALDSSVLIEYLTGTKTGEILKQYFETLKPEEKVSCSLLTISEVFYVLCRLRGAKFAEEKINDMLTSRVLDICDSAEIAVRTGKIKCERSISLADCSCIAVAEMANAKAVFAKKEKELVKEIEKKPFNREIIFLQDDRNDMK